MPENNLKQKNSFNIFLNEYFSVIVVFLCVVIFIFAYFAVLSPKLKSTTMAISDNIEAQKKLYIEQERKLAELKTIQQVYSEILPSDLDKFNQILPDEYLKEALYGELEEIVSKQGYILSAVSVNESLGEDDEDAKAMPQIGGTGVINPNIGEVRAVVDVGAINYGGFKNLLKTMEASSRLYDIKSVQFSENSGSAQFELISYYYKLSQIQ